jgi:hypothetical protein
VIDEQKEGTRNEFQLKLDQLVAEVIKKSCMFILFFKKTKFKMFQEGEDNFITKMYGGGLHIIPWPPLNDIAWFKELSKIKRKLNKQGTKYDNARTFLQNTKLIMAKLKVCKHNITSNNDL